jgi:hypothetical protein
MDDWLVEKLLKLQVELTFHLKGTDSCIQWAGNGELSLKPRKPLHLQTTFQTMPLIIRFLMLQ